MVPASKSEEGQKVKKEGLSVSYKINYNELTFGKELGKGGFGVVYQGTLNKYTDVAIKQLFSNTLSSEANEEFDTETQTMAELRHKNIVQFYGYCISPQYCIVMELMPGGSLFNVLRSKQPLEWTIRIRIALDMASGLAFLHQKNIVHRDIKSLNVLLDETGRAKLTDFGLSRVKAETKSIVIATKTNNKDAVGTIQWMAPELFQLRAIYTQKSDVYSFAMALWELVTRKIPYEGAPDVVIQEAVKNGEREELPKDCPKLVSLIQACWDATPDKRPDAGTIWAYLRSNHTDFTQFLSLSTERVQLNEEFGSAAERQEKGLQNEIKKHAEKTQELDGQVHPFNKQTTDEQFIKIRIEKVLKNPSESIFFKKLSEKLNNTMLDCKVSSAEDFFRRTKQHDVLAMLAVGLKQDYMPPHARSMAKTITAIGAIHNANKLAKLKKLAEKLPVDPAVSVEMLHSD